MTSSDNPYRPSPKEIRRQCTLIRMAWAPREYWERAGLAAIKQWTLPIRREAAAAGQPAGH